MTTYIRTLVSGGKARHKDAKLDVDLDLAYITDNVIVMGYPASGVEGLYRNKREDARRFLEHHHGSDYWIFNFCPVRENSYPSSYFGGRVSRYPFPDHHAPPLAILPLIAREMRLWLDGSPKRVAVLHCKAGKGRSGTMACAYLLSRDTASHKPAPERQLSDAKWAEVRADEFMDAMPEDADATAGAPAARVLDSEDGKEEEAHVTSPSTMSVASEITTSPVDRAPNGQEAAARKASAPAQSDPPRILQDVLALHTSKRMKAITGSGADGESAKGGEPGSPSKQQKKQKQGVSIPSQRRWLLYWSLLLSGVGPSGFWGLPGSSGGGHSTDPLTGSRPAKARITQITVRMRQPRGVAASLTRALNTIAHQTGRGNRNAPKGADSTGEEAWISLARYDDRLVETLERWERDTRSEDGRLGVRRPGSGDLGGERLAEMFQDEKWDKEKMVRSFARMGAITPNSVVKSEDAEYGKIVTYIMTPLTEAAWPGFKDHIKQDDSSKRQPNSSLAGLRSETGSVDDLTTQQAPTTSDHSLIVDAHREFRGKLYLGQVFYGWFWLIPSFHLPPSSDVASSEPTKVLLKRKEVDFPLALGEALIDVELSIEWASDTRTPPAKQSSEGSTGDATGLVANLGLNTA